MEVSIEKYQKDVAYQLISLFYLTAEKEVKEMEENNSLQPTQSDVSRWEDRIQENFCLLAKTGSTIIGFCELSTTHHIDILYVHPDYTGNKIASKLIESIKAYCIANSISNITVESGRETLSFYEQLGFSIVEKKTVSIRNVDLPNYMLRYNLEKN